MAAESDSATAPETHSYKQLRRQYETSIAKAKLEYAESGDNEKLWPAINARQDARDEAIFAKLLELDPPIGRDEIREVLKIAVMYLEQHKDLAMGNADGEFVIGLIGRASRGLIDTAIVPTAAAALGWAGYFRHE